MLPITQSIGPTPVSGTTYQNTHGVPTRGTMLPITQSTGLTPVSGTAYQNTHGVRTIGTGSGASGTWDGKVCVYHDK